MPRICTLSCLCLRVYSLELHDIGKKLTLRYFVFLQYILRYEEQKKSPDNFNISVWKKNINDLGDFIGE